MPKIVGGITQPCLRPLRMEKGSEMAPSKFIVPLTSSWKEAMMLSSCGGSACGSSPTVGKAVFCSERSNALVRSMKAVFKGVCCSRHFSLSWCTAKSYQ